MLFPLYQLSYPRKELEPWRKKLTQLKFNIKINKLTKYDKKISENPSQFWLMEELRRASHAGLSSITVIQLKKGGQEEDYGSGDESDSEIRVAHLGQLEGTCHNAYSLDGGGRFLIRMGKSGSLL